MNAKAMVATVFTGAIMGTYVIIKYPMRPITQRVKRVSNIALF